MGVIGGDRINQVAVAKSPGGVSDSGRRSAKYSGMARSYRPVIRDQEFLLPPNMVDWLPEDHLVWFVLDVVERLDTAAFHAGRRTGGVGRQGYDPDMLLGLLVYAYAVGERSSRRIERLCVDHVAFRVLCGQDGPDHTTVARFRAEHEDAFAGVFAQVLRLCATAGMVKVGIVSIDGTKIAANASKGANRTHGWVRDEAARIAAEVVADAAAVDAAEDATRDHDDDGGLPPGMATRKGRAANIAKALEEIERQESEHAEVDAADVRRVAELVERIAAGEPAPPGPMPAGTTPQAWYSAKIEGALRQLSELDGVRGPEAYKPRREAKRRIKLAEQRLAAAQDSERVDLRGPGQRLRERVADRARARGGLGVQVNTTDPGSRLLTEGSGGGSVQGYNAQLAVTDDHLILAIHISQDANDLHCFEPTLNAATIQADALGKDIELVLADAGYFTTDNITTPGPDRLIAPGKNHHVEVAAREHPADGPPPEDADPREQMRHRLRQPENARLYKRRSATVEPLNAHIKDQARLRRFARRGLTAALAELNLAAAAINLTRLHRASPAMS